ncbi:peptidase_M48 domain-containing protein [Haematococcus lacustris]|uniref:Peptidase_M48 domain-containing protein n=1 Tax=Haematococcus lacustris TaxID=44745 RepID=A0A699ZXE8_HAELA|nr:peptidase_M48 domain-containing protein [Haematococcus lacustris]
MELAAVLAHETAHVLARHHAERISSLNVFALLRLLCWTLLGFGLPQSVMVLGVFLPYSRRAEYEADAIGIRLMARACFDPVAATTMLSKLHSKEKELEGRSGVGVPQFMRTHPLTDDRVAKVMAELPEAYKLYQQSGCATTRGLLASGFEQLAPKWGW